MSPELFMFDSVDVAEIPRGAHAVAGYVDGHWQTWPLLRARWPHAHHLSITVYGGVAQCLDIEAGNPVPPERAGAWVQSMHRRGIWRPCIYASLSTMPAVRASLDRVGLPRTSYRLWVAHYDGVPVVPEGFDAKQYTSTARGRNLDASICAPGFFPNSGAHHSIGHAHLPVARHAPSSGPRRPIHRKVLGASAGAALSAGVVAIAHAFGWHFAPAEVSAIAAGLALAAGYQVKS
jgi:hypothetical protein